MTEVDGMVGVEMTEVDGMVEVMEVDGMVEVMEVDGIKVQYIRQGTVQMVTIMIYTKTVKLPIGKLLSNVILLS